MMVHGNDAYDSPDWVEAGLKDALAQLAGDPMEPVVAEHRLLSGMLAGFDPDVAAIVLRDRPSLVWLNARWNAYADASGEDLPPDLRSRIAEERHYQDGQSNLKVAHAAGHGWTDDEADSALFAVTAQELAATPLTGDERVLSGVRGDAPATPATREPWEISLRSQHFLILMRREGDRLVVVAQSAATSGSYSLVLHWPDGTTLTHDLSLHGGDVTEFDVEGHPGLVPQSATLRVAPHQ